MLARRQKLTRMDVARAQLVALIKSGYNALRLLARSMNADYRREQAHRAAVEVLLRDLAETSSERFTGRVLVDALFDNPNFWFRLTLLRRAMGLSHGHEVGLTGQFNARRCAATFRRLGIVDVVAMGSYHSDRSKALKEARQLLAATQKPDDVLKWKLPFDFPAEQAYDALLKWQRSAAVNIADPRLEGYLATCLQNLYAADRLLSEQHFDLVLISQPINFDEGGLSWVAAQRGIRSIVVTGHGGLSRFRKGFSPERVFAGGDRPSKADVEKLPTAVAEQLAIAGEDYLEQRLNGQTTDLGAIYAYQRRVKEIDRSRLTQMFGWDADKPIVTVYAANWFDYPHAFGMTNFRDFLDWMQVTLDAARDLTHVNWLFKAHPCDEWYGGVTLDDLLPAVLPAHIAVAPTDINSKDLLLSVDAIVTVHGTSALEFAHSGRPVLVADRGWYHDIGFCRFPESRAEYKRLLAEPWWQDVDRDRMRKLAHVFTGFVFCCPEWQRDLICGDDPEKGGLYEKLPALVHDYPDILQMEIDAIKDWLRSDTEGFHTHKMSRGSIFIVGNTTANLAIAAEQTAAA
jgi:hypothetical protein